MTTQASKPEKPPEVLPMVRGGADCSLTLKYLGINSYKDPIIYVREDSHICKSEGLSAQTRVNISLNHRSLNATLNTIDTALLKHNEASLSTYAWTLLEAKEGDTVVVSHPASLDSIDYIRAKIYGHELSAMETKQIVQDIVAGQLSDINIAMFIAASGGERLTQKEVYDLTKAMVEVGQQLSWPSALVVDKHCIGGVPGNRTTPIIVAIVAAYGLMIPKTSSRAITSPAGTADTVEVFTEVNIDIPTMRKIVEQENGCMIWGGAVALSPADELMIRIERTASLDSEGQMIASILSKKIAAGSTHIVIDVPIGPTVKVRSRRHAERLKKSLNAVAKACGITTKVIFTEGLQPIGRGIGPALEARDVLAVLKGEAHAPQDLKERALMLAGHVLEFCPRVAAGTGLPIAREILESGKALEKFMAICEAQGGLREIPTASFTHTIESSRAGKIIAINNEYIASVAKLAGAPTAKAAGVELLTPLYTVVQISQPLFTIHAETKGELQYALDFLQQGHVIFEIE